LRSHRPNRNHFQALAEAILSQQISMSAADTITARFRAIFPGKGFPTPAQVLKTPPAKLRRAGVSRQKADYLKDLARNVVTRKVRLANFEKLSDEEIITDLTRVKGIGRWTVEMFLMFSLRRPDVFSPGDLGLQNAVKKLYKLKHHPDKEKMEKLSAAWKPHRTLAARYLWASLGEK
jgi:DNA-3-methyladenine glycosylase II